LPCDLPQNGIFAEKFTKNGCLGRKNFYRWQLELLKVRSQDFSPAAAGE